MIFIDAIEIDERLATHFIGPDPLLRDQLISFRLSEFAIATPVLELNEPALVFSIIVSHGSQVLRDVLQEPNQNWATT